MYPAVQFIPAARGSIEPIIRAGRLNSIASYWSGVIVTIQVFG